MVPRPGRSSRQWRIALLLFTSACGTSVKDQIDADGDGYTADVDCDDANPGVHSGSLETCNGQDDDCDGQVDETDDTILNAITIYLDADGDGYGSGEPLIVCEPISGHVTQANDCDDDNPDIFPLAEEICNDIDDDCDDSIDENPQEADFWFPDVDGDGYGNTIGAIRSCYQPSGFVNNGDDCNDNDPLHSPETLEVCDGFDNDCDGLIDDDDDDLTTGTEWFTDADGDGYGVTTGSLFACQPPTGYTDQLEDCDDTTATISPGVLYDRCDGFDNDCDGLFDEDVKAGWPLFTADTNSDVVWDISLSNGGMTAQSNIQNPNIRLNSMDVSENGVSIVHDHLNGQLHYMDACTGVTSLIGYHNVGNTCGIVFGPGGKLYGLDTNNDALVEFDLLSGQGTIVGPIGFSIGNCGLAYDCVNDRLVGADGPTAQIFTLDPVTGQATDFIQSSVPFQGVGLEYVPSEQLLYASTGNKLYTVDPISGDSVFVGDLTYSGVDDLALHPSCP